MVILILLLCLALAPEAASGQDRDLVFERVPPESGLSQNSVFAIIQDRRGFLWVGTNEGLNRYDGYRFVSYRHDPRDATSLSDNRVQSLFEDRQGNLWVGTSAGANRLDQRSGRFMRVSVPAKTPKVDDLDNHDAQASSSSAWGIVWTQILEDRAGTVWLITPHALCRLDPHAATCRIYHLPKVPGRLYEDQTGGLWALGASTVEAHRYDRTMDRFLPVRLAIPPGWTETHWHTFREGRAGIWLTGSHGLALLDLSRQRIEPVADLLNDRRIRNDLDGLLWPDGAGLRRYLTATGGWQHFPLDVSGSSALNAVSTVYHDRAGTLWVGTLGGLYRSDPYARHFRHRASDRSNSNSLSSNLISAIHEDTDRFLWIGTIGGGVNRLNPRTERVTRFRHDSQDPHSLSNDVVWALHEDERGRLWIGTDDGLNVLNRRTGRFRIVRCDPGPHVSRRADPSDSGSDLANSVTAIVADREGAFWLGRYGGALFRFDPRTSQCQRMLPYNLSAASVAVTADPSGSIWIGVEGFGLQRFDPANGEVRQYPFTVDGQEGSAGRTVWAIHRSLDGRLWIATDLGLLRFDPSTETFTHVWDNALPSSVVYAIVEDGDQRLWLSTNNGICYFDPKAPPGQQFEHFSTADGLRNTEFNRRAGLRTRSGEVLFGGLQGLTSFDPRRIIRKNPIAPPVALSDVEARSREGARTINPAGLDRLMLSYKDYSFSFGFVALSFTNSTKNRYAYMLEGFDPDWVGPSARRIAQYTNVPPGTYVFRVKGSNNAGVWNHEGASLRLTITPPFWQRWWFRALTLGSIVGLLVLAHRYRVRQILAIERIRRQVATDLHDDVGSGLAQVAILSEVAKRDATPAAGAVMTETANLARGLRESMSDIVWAVDPRKDRLGDLVQRMRQTAFNALEADGLQVEFHAPDDDEIDRVGLTPDRRRQLLLIFKEAITNVARHAHASQVRIDLALHRGVLQLAIHDNGRGFDVNVASAGHGLDSLTRRVADLHGRLTIDSSPGRGTSIQLIAPLR